MGDPNDGCDVHCRIVRENLVNAPVVAQPAEAPQHDACEGDGVVLRVVRIYLRIEDVTDALGVWSAPHEEVLSAG